MAYNVSELAAYILENRELISKKFSLSAKSIESASIMPEVKGKANLNMLAVAPTLQAGNSCAWNASGDATFSARTLETACIKVNMEFCAKTLIGKWAEYQVRFGNKEDFPFGAYIIEEVAKGVRNQMEKLVWQGDTDNGDLFDGWLKIINAATGTVKETIASGKSAYDAIYQVYMAIPQGILGVDDLCIRVSPSIYRTFCKELTDANMFHYTAGEDPNRILLPGTNCPVILTEGLADSAGTNYRKIVATYDSNRYYGCDAVADMEAIDSEYERKTGSVWLKADFNAGVQVAYPDMIVLGTMQADPVSPARAIVSLDTIASN